MRSLVFLFMCVFLAIPCEGRIITVDDDGPADFNNIQAAIDDANDGDEIIVADGTYTGDGNRDIEFLGKAITVRSESGPQNCIVDCNSTREDRHRGFYFHHAEDANSVLDGFTITNGLVWEGGGAVFCEGSSPKITNCKVTGNWAGNYGGGIYCLNSSATVSYSTLSDNWANTGGGIRSDESSPNIANCTLIRNSGEAIVCYKSTPIIANCTITQNWGGGIVYIKSNVIISMCSITHNSGGGIRCGMYGGLITDCIITGNSRGEKYAGGGISCRDDATIIKNCKITGNWAPWAGGGISCLNSAATIKNCQISGNSTRICGGAIYSETYSDYPSPTIINCTITGNFVRGGRGRYTGGIYCDWGSSPTITNCILWGNSRRQIYTPGGTPPFVACSNVQGTWFGPGLGNINADPCFVEAGYWADANDANIIVEPNDPNAIWIEGDYHLLQTSPCIDTGDPNFIPEPNETDVEGNPRVADGDGDGNSVVDMGAYEFVIAGPAEPVEMLAELGEMVEELALAKGTENSLLAKVEAAIAVLEDDNEKNDGAAVNILGAFINAASAQSGKKIPEAQAEALIAEAMAIIEAIGSG